MSLASHEVEVSGSDGCSSFVGLHEEARILPTMAPKYHGIPLLTPEVLQHSKSILDSAPSPAMLRSSWSQLTSRRTARLKRTWKQRDPSFQVPNLMHHVSKERSNS